MSTRDRFHFLLRLSLIAIALGATACGSDDGSGITGTISGNGITLSGIPPKDSALQQLGIVITVSTGSTSFGTCGLQIDGNAGQGGSCFGDGFIMGVLALTPGKHTAHFTYAPYPSNKVTFQTSFSFTTLAPKIDKYAAVLLPPLPGDASAGAYDMNEGGVVVGESAASDGTTRAVKWIAGVPSALPHQAVEYGAAMSINAGGTVAGLLGPSDSATVVWTTSDSIITVTYDDPPVRVNDAGQVLTAVWSRVTPLPNNGFMIYDVATSDSTVVATSLPPQLVDFNNKGQAIGSNFGDFSDGFPAVWQYGGVSLPGVQAAYAPHSSSSPIDLTDSSEVLMSMNGWTVFGTSASSVVLNPFFGTGSPERANNDDVVVAVGLDSALYLWRKSANITERVDAGAGWTFSSVQKLNDDGAILARGTNSSTGQSGSVVLTPK